MKVSQREVVCLAVYLCGGNTKFVDTEDIAIKADEIAPGRFSWKKHPERIDKEVVRTYLSDLKKEKYGSLLDGTGKRGWILSAAGIEWMTHNFERLGAADLSWNHNESKSGSIDSMRASREEKRLKSLPAWIQWQEGEGVSISHAREVFRMDSYSDPEISKRKIGRLKQMFERDLSIMKFLNFTEDIVSKGNK